MPHIQLTTKVPCDNDVVKRLADGMYTLEHYLSKERQYRIERNIQHIYINNNEQRVLKSQGGLFDTIHMAYNHHINLRLKPDDLWITIAQGVSRYVDQNAEKLRHLFVEHKNKKQLCVEIEPNDWEKTLPMFHDMLQANVKNKEFIDIMTCDFSTSTPVTKAASTICIMASMQKYFDYVVELLCGIPNLILEGTLEDWEKLRSKVVRLKDHKIGLDWWLNALIPIITQFIDAYNGKVDEEFWSHVMTIKESWGSGVNEKITGWINTFYPFTAGGTVRKNLKGEMSRELYPNGLTEVLFELQNDGKTLHFVSGTYGSYFDVQDNSISPVQVWYIQEKTTTTSGLDKSYMTIEKIGGKSCCCFQ